jgi:hypothetical protein
MGVERPLRVENHGDRLLTQYPTHWKFTCGCCDFMDPFLSEGEARILLHDHICPAGAYPQ